MQLRANSILCPGASEWLQSLLEKKAPFYNALILRENQRDKLLCEIVRESVRAICRVSALVPLRTHRAAKQARSTGYAECSGYDESRLQPFVEAKSRFVQADACAIGACRRDEKALSDYRQILPRR